MPTMAASINDLPIPVRIFRAAMEQQRSLADYAQSLGISDANLRATVTAQLDQVEPDALDRLANLYHQSREVLSDRVSRPQAQESFASWLRRNMEGITQHGLRARAQLDTKTLKQFLNGDMLPDSDQSERIARALYIDRTEVARVVTATMIDQAAGTPKRASSGVAAAAVPASLPIVEEPAAARPPRTRRRKDASDGEPASAIATASDAPTKLEQSSTRPPRTQRRKDGSDREPASAIATATHSTTKIIDLAGELSTAPNGDAAPRPSARRQAGSKIVTAPSHPTATAQSEMAPAAGVERAPRPAVDRQAGTAAAATAIERTIESAERAPVRRDRPSEAAAESDAIPAAKVSAQRSTRQQRRSEAVAKLGVADTVAASSGARGTAAPPSQDPSEPSPATDTEPVAMAAPSAGAPPAGPASDPAGPVPADQSLPAESSQAAAVAPATKAAPPARKAKPAPSAASTAAVQEPAAAPLPGIGAGSPAALELTPDELRLIRHWRQLHPHGRRATLHYIGSLLVEE